MIDSFEGIVERGKPERAARHLVISVELLEDVVLKAPEMAQVDLFGPSGPHLVEQPRSAADSR